MDCRPPTGRDTGIVLSEEEERLHQESVAIGKAAKKVRLARMERLAAK